MVGGNIKIAQVAPIWISVPPKGYGGAELIISLLTDGLVARGHDVTLFASGDSETKAKLFSVIEKAPGLTRQTMSDIGYNMKHLMQMFAVLENADKFDLIHWHYCKDMASIMFAPIIKKPLLITPHNHFGGRNVAEVAEHYKDVKYFSSISNSHRKQFPFQFIGTVYNGIDVRSFEFNAKPEKYLVWLGRFSKTKGAHDAIKIALELGLSLKIAAPKDECEYFNNEIKPYLGKQGIEYVGEVNFEEKNRLLRNALILLNPISWEEPFGLVVPESNSCGTPVVAYNRGAMSEIIKDGINGFCVKPDDVDTMTEKVKAILALPLDKYESLRCSCRQYAEENFTVEKMVDGYEKVYEKILNRK